MRTLFLIILVISSVGVIISTLLMEPKAEGMGSISGSSSNVFGKGATRGKENLLNKLTLIFGVVFAVSTIIVTAITPVETTETEAPLQSTVETTDENAEIVEETVLETVEETTAE